MFLLSGVRISNVPADFLDGVMCFFLVRNLVEGGLSSSAEVEAHRMYHADIYVPYAAVNSYIRNRASPERTRESQKKTGDDAAAAPAC